MSSKDSKTEAPANASAFSQSMQIFGVVSFYFAVSLALVFANKITMNTLDFPYPLFVTWFQCLIQEVFILVLGYLSPRVPQYFGLFAPIEWDWEIAKAVSPLTVVYVAMIAFNNVCLRYVEVTFYQVARSLTLLWTIGFSMIMFPDQVIDGKTILSCLVVFSGFVVGSIGEVNFSMVGLIAGVISSAAVAYYGIAIKKALPHVAGSQWYESVLAGHCEMTLSSSYFRRLMIYNTTISIVLFVPVLAVFDEMPGLTKLVVTSEVFNALLITGVLGFLINIAIFMQVKYTTPLTNAISGTAKACLQTLLGWLFFRNEVSFLNFVGIVTVIGGSAWYSHIRYLAMNAEKPKSDKHDLENPPPATAK